MSAKAGTIEGTQRGVSWTGAWIAALFLTAILAFSLFAVNRSSGTADKVPATARFEVSDQMAGGPSRIGHGAAKAAPASQGIVIGNTVCHQCR
jgi:hypothetical protein